MNILCRAILLLGMGASGLMVAMTIGSDTTMNRFNTQQILDNGDRIAGFAALAGGLRLDGALVSGTFDSFMPVSGNIEMDSGTLILNQDLRLAVSACWLTIGSVIGNSHSIEFAQTMTAVAASSYAGPSGGKTLHDCDITFTLTTNVLAAAITGIDWSYDDRFLAVCLASNGTQEVCVYEFNSATITLTLRATVNLVGTANSIAWHPTKDIIAVGKVGGGADQIYTFTYSRAAQTLTQLTAVSFGNIQNGISNVTWHPSGNYLALAGQTTNADVRIYPVNASGTLNTAGLLTVNVGGATDANVVAWSPTGDRLAVGLAGGTQLQVYTIATTPSLSATASASLAVASNVNWIEWNPAQQNVLAVALATAPSPEVRFYTHSTGAGTLTEITTGLSLATQVLCLDWLTDGIGLAVGQVVNTAGELLTCRFVNNTVSIEEDITIGYAVNSVVWSHANKFLATGDSNGDLTIYMLDSAFAASMFYFSNLGIYLNSDVTFQNCNICFSGNSFIYGRNHTLTLAPTCTLSVAANSTLQCSNITINRLEGTELQCNASSSHLSLNNVTLQLADDYYFSQGYLDIFGSVLVQGAQASFIYQSSGLLSVNENSSLIFDSYITLSCDTPSPSFMNFYDQTASLVLNGATLHATLPGLQLANGTLSVSSTSIIESETKAVGATVTDNGITFGNGYGLSWDNGNDMRILVAFNAILQCTQGSINYKNVISDSFNNGSYTNVNFIAPQAALRMFPGTTLRLYQDIILGPSVIVFDANTTLRRAAGKSIQGSTQVFGMLSIAVL